MTSRLQVDTITFALQAQESCQEEINGAQPAAKLISLPSYWSAPVALTQQRRERLASLPSTLVPLLSAMCSGLPPSTPTRPESLQTPPSPRGGAVLSVVIPYSSYKPRKSLGVWWFGTKGNRRVSNWVLISSYSLPLRGPAPPIQSPVVLD